MDIKERKIKIHLWKNLQKNEGEKAEHSLRVFSWQKGGGDLSHHSSLSRCTDPHIIFLYLIGYIPFKEVWLFMIPIRYTKESIKWAKNATRSQLPGKGFYCLEWEFTWYWLSWGLDPYPFLPLCHLSSHHCQSWKLQSNSLFSSRPGLLNLVAIDVWGQMILCWGSTLCLLEC